MCLSAQPDDPSPAHPQPDPTTCFSSPRPSLSCHQAIAHAVPIREVPSVIVAESCPPLISPMSSPQPLEPGVQWPAALRAVAFPLWWPCISTSSWHSLPCPFSPLLDCGLPLWPRLGNAEQRVRDMLPMYPLPERPLPEPSASACPHP